ncbi:MAG TPA: hypothetical protein DEQ26_08000 [Flavobacteriaceae bacterium]|nr:hypothetical protein [Flavobacteriaceae bacterium]
MCPLAQSKTSLVPALPDILLLGFLYLIPVMEFTTIPFLLLKAYEPIIFAASLYSESQVKYPI